MAAITYAPGDPNTPSYLRNRANGWNGSQYVGPAPTAPAPATPAPAPTPYNSPAAPWQGAPRTNDPNASPWDPTPPTPGPAPPRYSTGIPRTNAPGPTVYTAPPPPPPPPTAPPARRPGNTGPVSTQNPYGAYTPTDFGGADPTQQQRQIDDAMRAAVPLGFDARKWADPTHQSIKYQAGRILAAGGSIGDVLRLPTFKGWTQISNDKIKAPDGAVFDLWFDYGGGKNQVQWIQVGNAPGKPPRAGSVPAGPPGVPGTIPGITPAGPNRAPGPTITDYGPGGGLPPGDPGAIHTGYTPQFSDPATRQLEEYLMAQMAALEAQRTAQGQANVGLRDRSNAAMGSADRLVQYLTRRSQELQQPAYTGAEQEILRTQMLDPIERDRQAANQRAVQNIGSRGFEPTSGIAQQLMGDVNRGYDQQRAAAQGDLAYRQVNEKRSREQEAQALMASIPQIQSGTAQQQLQFLQQLDAAMNAPRDRGIGLSQALYRLPAQAQSDAMAAMGMGGSSPDSIFQNAMSLYNAQQQQANQGNGWYAMLGQLMPYLANLGK